MIADKLKMASVIYFTRKGYGCALEIGLVKQGRFRADMLGVSLRGRIVLAEIKSSVQDFMSDTKYVNYEDKADACYYVMPEDVWTKLANYIRDERKRWGVLVLADSGYLKAVKKCWTVQIDPRIRREIITRMAFRAATYTKRNTRKRKITLVSDL